MRMMFPPKCVQPIIARQRAAEQFAGAWRRVADAVSIAGSAKGIRVAEKRKRKGFRPLYLLLLLPYIAMMWVPSYNRIEPEIAGVPFFYWYQLAWIVLGAAVMLPLYFSEERGK
jgi:hypothetical protein